MKRHADDDAEKKEKKARSDKDEKQPAAGAVAAGGAGQLQQNKPAAAAAAAAAAGADWIGGAEAAFARAAALRLANDAAIARALAVDSEWLLSLKKAARSSSSVAAAPYDAAVVARVLEPDLTIRSDDWILKLGSCQFESLADQLFLASGTRMTQEQWRVTRGASALLVRHQIVRWLRGNRTFCTNVNDPGTAIHHFVAGDYDAYCNGMMDKTAWGDHVTLMAACEVNRCHIRLYHDRAVGAFGVHVRVFSPRGHAGDKTLPTLRLWHWAEIHYSSVVPRDLQPDHDGDDSDDSDSDGDADDKDVRRPVPVAGRGASASARARAPIDGLPQLSAALPLEELKRSDVKDPALVNALQDSWPESVFPTLKLFRHTTVANRLNAQLDRQLTGVLDPQSKKPWTARQLFEAMSADVARGGIADFRYYVMGGSVRDACLTADPDLHDLDVTFTVPPDRIRLWCTARGIPFLMKQAYCCIGQKTGVYVEGFFAQFAATQPVYLNDFTMNVLLFDPSGVIIDRCGLGVADLTEHALRPTASRDFASYLRQWLQNPEFVFRYWKFRLRGWTTPDAHKVEGDCMLAAVFKGFRHPNSATKERWCEAWRKTFGVLDAAGTALLRNVVKQAMCEYDECPDSRGVNFHNPAAEWEFWLTSSQRPPTGAAQATGAAPAAPTSQELFQRAWKQKLVARCTALARKKGIACTITAADVPDLHSCTRPGCGRKLERTGVRGYHKRSARVWAVSWRAGFVPGNISVWCRKCRDAKAK